MLRLVAVHLAPVEAAVRDLLEIGNQAVHEVDLRVHGHVAGGSDSGMASPSGGGDRGQGTWPGRSLGRLGGGLGDHSYAAAIGRLDHEARRCDPNDELMMVMTGVRNGDGISYPLALHPAL